MIVIIFLVSFAVILAIFQMFKIPFVPGQASWKEVLFNLLVAALLAYLFDRGSLVIAFIILGVRLLWERAADMIDRIKGKPGVKPEEKSEKEKPDAN